MLDGRHDRFRFERWMSNGGESTLSSYGQPTCVDNIPESHWDLIASFVPFHETDDFIFTHANYCWYVPMKEQRGMELRWLSLETSEPRPHITEKIVILGHTPGVVRDAGHYRCIDTACGFGGYLTAMDVNTGHCWQVDESGKQEA